MQDPAAPPPPPPPSPDPAVLKTIDDAMTTALKAQHAAIAKCLAGEPTAAEVTLTVTLGKGAFEIGGATDRDKVLACLKPIASKLRFATAPTPVKQTFKR
jgi:hypothetical protein